jgi:hypothetical protein
MVRQTAYWKTGVANSHGKPVFGTTTAGYPSPWFPSVEADQAAWDTLLRNTGVKGVIMVDNGAAWETGAEYLAMYATYTDVYFPAFKQACINNGVLPIIQIEMQHYGGNYWVTGSWDRIKTQFDHDFPLCTWFNLFTLAHIRPDYRPEQAAIYDNIKNYLNALPEQPPMQTVGFY